MSGIVGIYYLDQRPVSCETLGKMVDALAHRGPDGADVWYESSIGLGHRLLWTTPESLLETLPLVDQTGNLVLTADARLDNRDELIETLGLKSQRVEKITDSQLILATYEKWGEQCPEQLLGDFAFAIWDKRQQKLFCARDQMGIKPFYYYYSNRVFVFASEIKALLCLPEVPRKLNQLMVAYHLATFFEDTEITFYQDILRLPAAHRLSLSYQKMQVQAYWALNREREIRLSSAQEYSEAFREIFTEAVRCRLRSAFPIGSALSGGLDSSSIACLASQQLAPSGKKLHTFSAIFPSLPQEERRWIDERHYIEAVKAQGRFESHNVEADQLSPLINLLWQGEEAILATNLYIHWGLYDCAHQQGVRIFLDGFDGDTTVSHGWRYLTELTYTGRWRRMFSEVSAAARRFRVSRQQIFWQYCLSPLLLEPANLLGQRLGYSESANNLVNKAFAQRVGLAERSQALLSKKPVLTLKSKQKHLLGLTRGLYPYVLEMADKATARQSLEGRYPFFDRRLIEFCLAVPSEQKFRHGWPRAIQRFAMTDILPPQIQWRVSKGDLSPNFKRRLLECERETLERVIKQPQLIEPYVDLPNLSAAYQRYTCQPHHRAEDGITVLAAVTLALWLEKSNLSL